MTNAFRTQLTEDLRATFFNPEEFGEQVTLTRGNTSVAMRGLFDAPGIEGGEQLGGDVNSISHAPRLFVRSADLPDNKPLKGDIFALELNEFHKARKLRAVDFVFEQDGAVVYRLVDCR